MTTHSIDQIKSLVQTAKNLKAQHLSNALSAVEDDVADRELLLAESLAAVELHAQAALVRYLRVENSKGAMSRVSNS